MCALQWQRERDNVRVCLAVAGDVGPAAAAFPEALVRLWVGGWVWVCGCVGVVVGG